LPKVLLPPGCNGFADGDKKYLAERGPGSFVNLDDDRQLRKLRNQDYASAGLVDAGPEKYFITKGPEGRFCPGCPDNTIWHSWTRSCPSCGSATIMESGMVPVKMAEYVP
jgi:hypothetical protein